MSTDVELADVKLEMNIKATGTVVTIDPNPVWKYAFFCKLYNESCNIVDGKAYQVPNLTTWRYKLYRFICQHSFAGMTQSSWLGFFDEVNCESFCCLFQALYAIVNVLFPLALMMLTFVTIIFYIISNNSYRR